MCYTKGVKWGHVMHNVAECKFSFDALKIDPDEVGRVLLLPLPYEWPLEAPRKKSRKTRTWTTPPHFIAAVLAGLGIEHFDLDAASPEEPSVPCRRWFTERDNGPGAKMDR
jgi:hypothetical protein